MVGFKVTVGKQCFTGGSAAALLLAIAFVGCASSSAQSGDAGGGGAANVPSDGAAPNNTPIQSDGGFGSSSADASHSRGGGHPSAGDSGSTPQPGKCTSKFGSAITTVHGRLDGTLTAIVSQGARGCNGDSKHIHLQISSSGATYDVAVTVVPMAGGDVAMAERDAPLGGDAWAEGWHTTNAGLDYVSAFGVHSGDFAPIPAASLEQSITGALTLGSPISVYATGYGPTGVHLVHRNRGGGDGAIVIHPQASTSHFLLFHFPTQSF